MLTNNVKVADRTSTLTIYCDLNVVVMCHYCGVKVDFY